MGVQAVNEWNIFTDSVLLPFYVANTYVHPPSVATTEFVITPLSYGLLSQPGGYDSSLLEDQMVVVQPVTLDTGTLSQVYDRNENTLSATKEKKVTCVGVATLDELLGSGILNNPAFQSQGGWAYLFNKPFDADPNTPGQQWPGNFAWTYKVESSSALGSFMINGLPNGGWLFTGSGT